MAIGSEVFGKYVVEIDVSVEIKNVVVWLCCGWKGMRLFWEGEVAQYLRWKWEMMPGIPEDLRWFG